MAAGRAARLGAWFELGRSELAAAPLTRLLDATDAADGRWLRADPAHVAADIATARLLACGGLGVTPEERQAFERTLKPLFGDGGLEFSAPHPDRWYVRMRGDAELPVCAPPEQAVGGDLAECLPSGPAGARFRHLLNEAQMLLHQHPVNQRRSERDAAAVNSLWFWGGGVLPKQVASGFGMVASIDPVVAGLARLGRVALTDARRWADVPMREGALLADLQELDARAAHDDWLAPALDAVRSGRLPALDVALPDGRTYRAERGQRWRFWRRARALA
jgi:hypothetical protein